MTDDLSGPELAAMRLSRGWSQTVFGKLIGRTGTQVSKWEREAGCRPPKWLRNWFRGYDAEQRGTTR